MQRAHLLAQVDFSNPMLWAIVIGWILSVVLHEFAHGLVAYWGGDYTIRERGGLTLNPLQYIDPIFSIALPVLFLLMGGIPLPGGVTYIRRDLIRSAWWNVAVSAAGPAMNLLLFVLLSIPFHPTIGWLDPIGVILGSGSSADWPNGYVFLAAMAQLQMIAVIINLIPIPPLDGFQMISPFLDERTRVRLTTPPVSTIAILVLFLVIWRSERVMQTIYELTDRAWIAMGFDSIHVGFFGACFNLALFGETG